MIYSLIDQVNLRGYAFEFVAKSILRRQSRNNFIFALSQFDNIDEILTKYRLVVSEDISSFIDYLRIEWNRCDLIEFKLNNKKERLIEGMVLYDVKTKFHMVKRDYFEVCSSNDIFMTTAQAKYEIDSFIISLIMFDRWRFSFNLFPYYSSKKRIYSRVKT